MYRIESMKLCSLYLCKKRLNIIMNKIKKFEPLLKASLSSILLNSSILSLKTVELPMLDVWYCHFLLAHYSFISQLFPLFQILKICQKKKLASNFATICCKPD